MRPAASAAAGTAGRKKSLRVVRTALIEDFDAALMALKDAPEIRDVVQRLVNRVTGDKADRSEPERFRLDPSHHMPRPNN